MRVCRVCRGIPDRLSYLVWHGDAQARMRRGQKQRRCPQCNKYEWLKEYAVRGGSNE